MSYSIVYDRQVIKTPTGYSFMILSGDNNVYDNRGGRWRRARSWNCWPLNKSEQEIRNYFESWCKNGCGEHFRWNGKFLDDDGLRKWVNTGLKNAKTVEDILLFSGYNSIHAVLSVWHKGASDCNHVLDRYLTTTEGFESWCREVQDYYGQHSAEADIFIKVGVSSDEPLGINRCNRIDGPVILKSFGNKESYVSSVFADGSWHELHSDIEKAIVFDSFNQAEPVIRASNQRHYNHKIYAVPAVRQQGKEPPKNYVILASFDSGRVSFIVSIKRNRFLYSDSPDAAKKYTKAQAKQSCKRLAQRRFSNVKFEVKEIA